MKWAVLGMVVLAGCSETLPYPAPPPEVAPSKTIIVSSKGIIASGNGTANGSIISFGRTQASAIESTSKLIGVFADDVFINDECGEGPTDLASWDAGIRLLFQQGNFRGWVATSPNFKTSGGIAPGLTAEHLTNAGISLKTTTIGREFEAGGVFGLIEDAGPDAKVTTTWAGNSCFFR